jgi:prevent-host-death family protein
MAKEIDLNDARPQLESLVDELLSGGEPVALTTDGKPVLVMLSWDDYDLLLGAVQQLSREWEGGLL